MDWQRAIRGLGNEKLLKQLVDAFLQETAQLLPELREAISEKNTAEVRRLSHTIKGSAALFAATSTEDAASRLETIGSENDLEGAEEAYTALHNEVERLNEALQAAANQ